MSKTKTKTLNISGVQLTKAGFGKVEADFGEDEFGDEVKFVLRKPDIFSIVLASGKDEIPSFFREAVMNLLNGRKTATGFGINSLEDGTPSDVEKKGPFGDEDLPKLNSLLHLVCDAAFSADPRYGADGPDGISFEDLPLGLRFWVFSWAMPREVAALMTFPEGGQSESLGSSPDGQELRAETVGTAEDQE